MSDAATRDSDRTTERRRVSEFLHVAFKSRRLQLFANETESPVDIDQYVVVSVDRGEDLGRVISKYRPSNCNRELQDGVLLRIALTSDMTRHESNMQFESKVLKYCKHRIKIRKLDMRLTDCEVQLDRRRIRIFFTADQRTDFRGLVRDLAAEFKARIEMRQIGVRDDAKHKDGVGICGRRLCCSQFLNRFNSVTLKTVREQHLSPNPSKISGVCGRLMCCLAFESEFYRRAVRLYPEKGYKVIFGNRKAKVTEVDIFREFVTVVFEDSDEEETIQIEEFHRKKSSQKLDRSEKRGNRSGGENRK